MLSDDSSKKVATYVLVAHGEANLTAAIPYVDKPYAINPDGSIELEHVPASAISLTTVEVTKLDPPKLSVHKEDVDFKAMYLDIMRSNNIKNALIAAIGRKGEVRKMFDSMKVGEPLVDITLPNFNATLYALKQGTKAVNVVCFQISPDFFGDRSGYLAAALSEIGVKHITFVGTAGALASHIKKFDVMVPEELANFANRLPKSDDKIESSERTSNAAFPLMSELETSADLTTTSKQSGGLHLNVHSPITESQAMIEWMKKNDVQSVDCEAGFIADALKGSGVNLYAIYFISDVPGTEESIGMGGVTGASTTASPSTSTSSTVKGPEASERMVREIIKKVIGQEIERADGAVPPDIVKVTRDGKIAVLVPGKTKNTFVKADMSVSVALPGIGVGSDAIGVLRTFAQTLASVPKGEEERPQLTEAVQKELNTKVRDFYSTHRVKVLWSVK